MTFKANENVYALTHLCSRGWGKWWRVPCTCWCTSGSCRTASSLSCSIRAVAPVHHCRQCRPLLLPGYTPPRSWCCAVWNGTTFATCLSIQQAQYSTKWHCISFKAALRGLDLFDRSIIALIPTPLMASSVSARHYIRRAEAHNMCGITVVCWPAATCVGRWPS